MMRQKKYGVLSILLLICLILCSACGNRNKENVSEKDENAGFSCFAENPQGGSVQAFFNESDGTWYLVVPSSWNLTELDLRYTGQVTESEKGELNQKASSVSGAFGKSGDKTVLKTGDGTSAAVMVLQSDLPSVQISLDGVSLDAVHEDKTEKFRGNTVLITDADGNVAVEALNNVELKGRGNSTWQRYDKKGYQIKFSAETDVLGMGQAAKWVLLSNASDDSMVRTRVVYDAAKQLNMAFVPDFEYVDLWINGEYRGTYMIGEKVELVSSRLDLKNPMGVLFERDDAFFEEEMVWEYNPYLEAHFVIKETVSDNEQLIPTTLKEVSGDVTQLMRYLYETPSAEITLEELSQRIDVDSFALYYLINEYVQNRESLSTSFYWFKDGTDDVLHLGPIWDFDTCMGNDGAENTEYYCHNSLLFKYLLAVPEFYQRTQTLYSENKNVFDAMSDRARELGEQIQESARANYLRWDVWGAESAKLNGAAFAGSYSEALNNVTEWLFGRAKLFEIPRTSVVASTVSDDYGTLNIRYQSDEDYGPLRFVCWNRSSEDSSVMWYDGVLENGAWNVAADLTFFQEAGLYQIGVYASGSEEPIASGVNYVAGVKENPYVLETELTADMNQITITVADPEARFDGVNFVIWSTEDSQDDLQVFAAQKDDSGLWRSTVDLTVFQAEGEYNIHVFGQTIEGSDRMNATTFIRYPIWAEGENPYLIETDVSEDSTSVTITLTVPKDDCSLVNFLVWSSAGGQSDLQVCPAERIGEGLWRYTVDLTQYEIEGEYNVHAFGEKPYDYIKLNTAVFNVEFSQN